MESAFLASTVRSIYTFVFFLFLLLEISTVFTYCKVNTTEKKLSAWKLLALSVKKLFFSLYIPNWRLFLADCHKSAAKIFSLFQTYKYHIFLSFLIWGLSTAAAAFLFIGVCVMLLLLVIKLLAPSQAAGFFFWFWYRRLETAGTSIIYLYVFLCLFSILLAIFSVTPSEYLLVRHTSDSKPAARMAKYTFITLFLFLYVSLSAFDLPNSSVSSGIQIISHRAGAAYAPENTLAALRETKTSGAVCAEIDVQLTKDDELIVLHDTSFERITGIKKKVWDVTLSESRTYNAGNSLSTKGYLHEKIPTLEEMIKAAGSDIRLMIELKSNKHNQEIVQKTLNIIEKNGFEEHCTIASMDYHLLVVSKEINPAIPTVFITDTKDLDIEALSAADALSIEENAVTPSIIASAHSYGKRVYIWTLNRESSITRAIEMNADGIITDNPYLAAYLADAGGKPTLLSNLVKKGLY